MPAICRPGDASTASSTQSMIACGAVPLARAAQAAMTAQRCHLAHPDNRAMVRRHAEGGVAARRRDLTGQASASVYPLHPPRVRPRLAAAPR
jgi:hypothetical protein